MTKKGARGVSAQCVCVATNTEMPLVTSQRGQPPEPVGEQQRCFLSARVVASQNHVQTLRAVGANHGMKSQPRRLWLAEKQPLVTEFRRGREESSAALSRKAWIPEFVICHKKLLFYFRTKKEKRICANTSRNRLTFDFFFFFFSCYWPSRRVFKEAQMFRTASKRLADAISRETGSGHKKNFCAFLNYYY